MQPEEEEAAGRNFIIFLSCSLLRHIQVAGQCHLILRTYLGELSHVPRIYFGEVLGARPSSPNCCPLEELKQRQELKR